MKLRTEKNLKAAMQSAAMASAQYLRFAACARADEDWQLADLFQNAADVERCRHFARESALLGLGNDSEQNLREAISAKAGQIEMYDHFLREAIADDDLQAAANFEKMRTDEIAELRLFQAAFDKLAVGKDVQAV